MRGVLVPTFMCARLRTFLHPSPRSPLPTPAASIPHDPPYRAAPLAGGPRCRARHQPSGDVGGPGACRRQSCCRCRAEPPIAYFSVAAAALEHGNRKRVHGGHEGERCYRWVCKDSAMAGASLENIAHLLVTVMVESDPSTTARSISLMSSLHCHRDCANR